MGDKGESDAPLKKSRKKDSYAALESDVFKQLLPQVKPHVNWDDCVPIDSDMVKTLPSMSMFVPPQLAAQKGFDVIRQSSSMLPEQVDQLNAMDEQTVLARVEAWKKIPYMRPRALEELGANIDPSLIPRSQRLAIVLEFILDTEPSVVIDCLNNTEISHAVFAQRIGTAENGLQLLAAWTCTEYDLDVFSMTGVVDVTEFLDQISAILRASKGSIRPAIPVCNATRSKWIRRIARKLSSQLYGRYNIELFSDFRLDGEDGVDYLIAWANIIQTDTDPDPDFKPTKLLRDRVSALLKQMEIVPRLLIEEEIASNETNIQVKQNTLRGYLEGFVGDIQIGRYDHILYVIGRLCAIFPARESSLATIQSKWLFKLCLMHLVELTARKTNDFLVIDLFVYLARFDTKGNAPFELDDVLAHMLALRRELLEFDTVFYLMSYLPMIHQTQYTKDVTSSRKRFVDDYTDRTKTHASIGNTSSSGGDIAALGTPLQMRKLVSETTRSARVSPLYEFTIGWDELASFDDDNTRCRFLACLAPSLISMYELVFIAGFYANLSLLQIAFRYAASYTWEMDEFDTNQLLGVLLTGIFSGMAHHAHLLPDKVRQREVDTMRRQSIKRVTFDTLKLMNLESMRSVDQLYTVVFGAIVQNAINNPSVSEWVDPVSTAPADHERSRPKRTKTHTVRLVAADTDEEEENEDDNDNNDLDLDDDDDGDGDVSGTNEQERARGVKRNIPTRPINPRTGIPQILKADHINRFLMSARRGIKRSPVKSKTKRIIFYEGFIPPSVFKVERSVDDMVKAYGKCMDVLLTMLGGGIAHARSQLHFLNDGPLKNGIYYYNAKDETARVSFKTIYDLYFSSDDDDDGDGESNSNALEAMNVVATHTTPKTTRRRAKPPTQPDKTRNPATTRRASRSKKMVSVAETSLMSSASDQASSSSGVPRLVDPFTSPTSRASTTVFDDIGLFSVDQNLETPSEAELREIYDQLGISKPADLRTLAPLASETFEETGTSNLSMVTAASNNNEMELPASPNPQAPRSSTPGIFSQLDTSNSLVDENLLDETNVVPPNSQGAASNILDDFFGGAHQAPPEQDDAFDGFNGMDLSNPHSGIPGPFSFGDGSQ